MIFPMKTLMVKQTCLISSFHSCLCTICRDKKPVVFTGNLDVWVLLRHMSFSQFASVIVVFSILDCNLRISSANYATIVSEEIHFSHGKMSKNIQRLNSAGLQCNWQVKAISTLNKYLNKFTVVSVIWTFHHLQDCNHRVQREETKSHWQPVVSLTVLPSK